MATAVEKIEKIENVHDDGTSTKLSEPTTTTRESEPVVDSGKFRLQGVEHTRENSTSKVLTNCKSRSDSETHCVIIDNNNLVLIEHQLTAPSKVVLETRYREHLKLVIMIQRLIRIRCRNVMETWILPSMHNNFPPLHGLFLINCPFSTELLKYIEEEKESRKPELGIN